MGGPGAMAWFGAVAGIAAALTIGLYVRLARRPGYDPWRDTMTALGDETDRLACWFPVVNTIVAGLLGVFAAGVVVRLPLPPTLWVNLFVAAGLSAVIGLTACKKRCRRPCRAGTASTGTRWLHGGASLLNAFGIIGVPVATSIVMRNEPGYLPLRVVGYPLSGVAVGSAIAYVWSARRNQRDFRSGNRPTALPGLYERLLWIWGYAWVITAAISLLTRDIVGPFVGFGVWLAVSLFGVLRPGWRDRSPEFALADCQPFIVRGHDDARCGVLVVSEITEPEQFGTDLYNALSLFQQPDWRNAGHAIALGVSRCGFERLGIPYRWNARYLHDSFASGMRARARELGDTGDNEPAKWAKGWERKDDLHAAFWIVARSTDDRQRALELIKDAFPSTSRVVTRTTRRIGELELPQEHFGFVDGVSNPWIDRVHERKPADDLRGAGVPKQGGGWRPVALGEFLLGHVDETGDIFPVPDPVDVFEGGTFMVVRVLEQDVKAFRSLAPDDAVAHQLVGRTKQGKPLRSPLDMAQADNDVRFGEDPEGRWCPRGAHVRRANPREGLGFAGTFSSRRRIIRRGMPYGPDYNKDDEHDKVNEEERGLVFIAFNARIAEQFEFIQTNWLNTGVGLGLGSDPDVVSGQWPKESVPRMINVRRGDGSMTRCLAAPLVRMRGGEYFFVPSIPGLRKLARLTRPSSATG